MKNNYARIQTIAHECLHSCQDRTMLLFNFIFSNINMIYFFVITILTIFKIINNQMLQIAILMLFTLIQFAVRSFLEIDAMTRARFLAKEYMENKKLCTNEEKEQLLKSLIDDKEVFKAEIKYNEEKDMDEVILETISGTMRMFTFSDLSDQVLEELPELVTNEREGQCYRLTYNINRHLGLPHEMVTGYVYGYTDISKFLHSWIELTYKGEEYVIDGTMDALIDKKTYYTLKKCQPITRISDETFQSDLDNHMDLLNGVNIEVYLIYRDEIISGQPLKPEKFNIGTGPTFK